MEQESQMSFQFHEGLEFGKTKITRQIACVETTWDRLDSEFYVTCQGNLPLPHLFWSCICLFWLGLTSLGRFQNATHRATLLTTTQQWSLPHSPHCCQATFVAVSPLNAFFASSSSSIAFPQPPLLQSSKSFASSPHGSAFARRRTVTITAKQKLEARNSRKNKKNKIHGWLLAVVPRPSISQAASADLKADSPGSWKTSLEKKNTDEEIDSISGAKKMPNKVEFATTSS